MTETFNVISLMDTLGLVQGLLLGILLLVIHGRKRRAVIFLGLFIILFSLEPLENIFNELGILKKMPHLILMPVSFHFLAFPLFYIYLQKISVLENEKPSYWTLLPGFVELLIGCIVFFLPIHIKTWIKDSNAMLIYFLLGMAYSLIIQFIALKWIDRHRKELLNQYSFLQHRSLMWSTYFIYACIGFSILFLLTFLTDNHLIYLCYSMVNVVLIYWISYQGFAQQNVVSLLDNGFKEHVVIAQKSTDKNLEKVKTEERRHGANTLGSVEEEALKKVLDDLHYHMVSSKCFTKEDLTIIDVSEAIAVHPRKISQAINSLLHTNFNNYINSFRVEYAKELFIDDKAKQLSIEGIGIESGFHSKSTFYAAFRKIEGTTPAQYREHDSTIPPGK